MSGDGFLESLQNENYYRAGELDSDLGEMLVVEDQGDDTLLMEEALLGGEAAEHAECACCKVPMTVPQSPSDEEEYVQQQQQQQQQHESPIVNDVQNFAVAENPQLRNRNIGFAADAALPPPQQVRLPDQVCHPSEGAGFAQEEAPPPTFFAGDPASALMSKIPKVLLGQMLEPLKRVVSPLLSNPTMQPVSARVRYTSYTPSAARKKAMEEQQQQPALESQHSCGGEEQGDAPSPENPQIPPDVTVDYERQLVTYPCGHKVDFQGKPADDDEPKAAAGTLPQKLFTLWHAAEGDNEKSETGTDDVNREIEAIEAAVRSDISAGLEPEPGRVAMPEGKCGERCRHPAIYWKRAPGSDHGMLSVNYSESKKYHIKIPLPLPEGKSVDGGGDTAAGVNGGSALEVSEDGSKKQTSTIVFLSSMIVFMMYVIFQLYGKVRELKAEIGI